MAWLSAANVSGRNLYANELPTSYTTLYTSPNADGNVTSPSATAQILEVVLCNTTIASITVTLAANGFSLLSGEPIAPNSKEIINLNTFLNAGSIIGGNASATGLHCSISGAEVQ